MTIPTLDIQPMLTISTCHISEDTRNYLDELAINPKTNIPIVVYQKEVYGYIIYIDMSHNNDIEHLPSDLTDCISLALSVKCNILCIDGDGLDISPLLPIYPDYDNTEGSEN